MKVNTEPKIKEVFYYDGIDGNKLKFVCDKFNVYDVQETITKLSKAIELFKKCQQAQDKDILAINYAEFNEYFNKAFVK